MTYTDEKVNLVINKMTTEQYIKAKAEGILNDNELYITPDLDIIPTKTSQLYNDSNYVTQKTLNTEVGNAKYLNGQMWHVEGSSPDEYVIQGVDGEDLTIQKMVNAYRSGGFRLTFGAPSLSGDGIWDVANFSTTSPYFITFYNIAKDETTGDYKVGIMKVTPKTNSSTATRFYRNAGSVRIASKSSIPTKTSQLENDSGFLDGEDKDELNKRIDLIEATSHPNMNVIGSPTFSEGSVGGFSENDYLMFPTSVNVGNNNVEFYMTFTTGDDVSTQQNIIDSWCGLALAIQNGHFILAASSNGTTFDVANGAIVVEANTPYDIKVSFRYENDKYIVELGVKDGVSYNVDAQILMNAPLFATPTYWGGANPTSGVNHIFGGTINLNKCWMVWNEEVIWRGYSELPIPTKVSQLTNDSGFITQEAIPTNISYFQNDQGYIDAGGKSEIQSDYEQKIYELKTELETQISEKANTVDIPNSVSQLSNDMGFITQEEVPTKVSELENDSGYITQEAVPTSTSQLTNDSGFITQEAIPTNISYFQNDQGYIDAAGRSEIQSDYDWKINELKTNLEIQIGQKADTTDVPTLTSQLENDNGFITQESVPTFVSQLSNDSGYITIDDVPTQTSQLVNDSGFITIEDVPQGSEAIYEYATDDGRVNVRLVKDAYGKWSLENDVGIDKMKNALMVVKTNDGVKMYQPEGIIYDPTMTDYADTWWELDGNSDTVTTTRDVLLNYQWYDMGGHWFQSTDIKWYADEESYMGNNTYQIFILKVIDDNGQTKVGEFGRENMFAIPTKTSELVNDDGFVTAGDVDVKIDNIPTTTISGEYEDGSPFAFEVLVKNS